MDYRALIERSKDKGHVTMLIPTCDIDDMLLVNSLLKILNKVNVPKSTYSAISRVRSSSDSVIYYAHTIRKNQ